MKSHDTRSVDLSSKETVFAPRLAEYWHAQEFPGSDLARTTENRRFYGGGKATTSATVLNGPVELSDPPESGIHRVAIQSNRLRPRLQALLAATWLDFVSSSGEPMQTRQLEATKLVQSIQSYRNVSISVSDRLRGPRERMLSTSMLVPSGAYLTWLAMESEDGSNGN